MLSSQSVSPEMLAVFRSDFDADPIAGVAARAASKSSLHDICYDTQRAKTLPQMFSIDIPTMGALNQKNSGRCWIFAGMNLLREKVAQKLNLPDFELSQSYICFYDHLEKANSFLEHVIETADTPLDDRYVSMMLRNPVGDGGWWEYFVGLCIKYGVVPKEAMPETYQSSNTDDLNLLLCRQLRKDAVTLRRASSEGKAPEQLRSLKNSMLNRVYRFLAICLGTPPQEFDFEYVDKENRYHAGRNLTPVSFYETYLGTDLRQIVSILNAPSSRFPFHRTYVTPSEESICGKFHAKRLNLPMEEFKAAVIRQLKQGEPVWFVCDCDYDFHMEEGIWDTGLYDYETPFGLDFELDKGDLLEYRQCTLNHAMLLTGVNLVDGVPDRWKVENSWGTEKGRQGYFVMSDEWFDRYVFTASIDRLNLTEQQNLEFDQAPLELPLWNVLA